jgi:hypothetical protein
MQGRRHRRRPVLKSHLLFDKLPAICYCQKVLLQTVAMPYRRLRLTVIFALLTIIGAETRCIFVVISLFCYQPYSRNSRISARRRSRRLIISCKDSTNSEVGSISAAGVRRAAEFPCQSAVDRQNSAADEVGAIGPKSLIYKAIRL